MARGLCVPTLVVAGLCWSLVAGHHPRFPVWLPIFHHDYLEAPKPPRILYTGQHSASRRPDLARLAELRRRHQASNDVISSDVTKLPTRITSLLSIRKLLEGVAQQFENLTFDRSPQ
ncbi:hypothetical protein ACOMHN_013060 [Nucella lapillus]